MFNTFPTLLVYSFFAPLVLRIAIAVVFAYLSYHAFAHRKAAASPLPFVGGPWAALFAALAYSIVGLLLLVGAYTQLAAVAGMALLGTATLAREHAAFTPLSKSSVLLTFVILGSLLLTGAGALAFDLPL